MHDHLTAAGRRAFLMAGAAFVAAGSAAARPTRIDVSGAADTIDILDDRHGVAHVRATTRADAFFGQGYVTARDRLWELDLGHRQGLGRLAEVYGPDFVAADTAARLFLYQGDVAAELAALDPEIRACAQGYVDGINAFIARTRREPALLAPIFAVMGYAPLDWALEDLVRVRAEATGNTRAEIRRARLAARGRLDLDPLLMPLDPPWTLRVPDGLEAGRVGEEDLGWFGVLMKGPPFATVRTGPDGGRGVARQANEGSNAWVVARHRTTTGRPILANDPHLDLDLPGPRHVVHLGAPGLDAIGGAIVGMPGVAQGHNDAIAWARTNFHIDQEDLFVLQTDPARPGHYRHDGGWVAMQERVETIRVRGAADARVRLRFARQGPVVSEDAERGRAVAVAASWLAPGACGMVANIAISLARDWSSFRAALHLHTSPTNFLYADTAGNIGWQAAGRLPARADGHDGLLPAPGDGRYDWRGLRGLDDLPHVLNPADGWFASSNEMNLPAGFDQARLRVSFEWSPPYRHRRVAEVLSRPARISVGDCVALQHDTYSALARDIAGLVSAGAGESRDVAAAVALLRAWDGHVTADSAAAALYEVWWTHMGRALHARAIPTDFRDLLPELHVGVREAMLRDPARHASLWGGDPVVERDGLMMACLRSARAELVRRLGADMSRWSWGALHTVSLAHAFTRHVPAVAARYPAIGGADARSGGDAYTVQARWYSGRETDANPYAVTGGASYLMVCDVGGWDSSAYLNFPGQSDLPHSPFYADAVPDWLAGRMRPMLFSVAAVAPAVVARQRLIPG